MMRSGRSLVSGDGLGEGDGGGVGGGVGVGVGARFTVTFFDTQLFASSSSCTVLAESAQSSSRYVPVNAGVQPYDTMTAEPGASATPVGKIEAPTLGICKVTSAFGAGTVATGSFRTMPLTVTVFPTFRVPVVVRLLEVKSGLGCAGLGDGDADGVGEAPGDGLGDGLGDGEGGGTTVNGIEVQLFPSSISFTAPGGTVFPCGGISSAHTVIW